VSLTGKTFPKLVKPEGSLSFSKVRILTFYILTIHFNNIVPSTRRFFKLSFPSRSYRHDLDYA
jgi:hypothetical protein